jgi:hypothetical protein
MEEWHDIEIYQDGEGNYGSDDVPLSGDPKIMGKVGLPTQRYIAVSRILPSNRPPNQKDNIILPEIPGPRYIINQAFAWICVGIVASIGFVMGFCIAILLVAALS